MVLRAAWLANGQRLVEENNEKKTDFDLFSLKSILNYPHLSADAA
nr:hypothetical protein [Ectobacillus panaciterrae]